jgi:quercetin dioxygenase-like cupin family protein
MHDTDMNRVEIALPDPAPVRPQQAEGRWAGVDLLHYKAEGSAPFRDITRQVLFQDPALACELRYFEIQPGGYSTLERHEHAHAVMVQRGRGQVLVGRQVFDLEEHALVHIPALTWHQFRAPADAPLGFLCMVNRERDRPQLPTAEDLASLRSEDAVAVFLRT